MPPLRDQALLLRKMAYGDTSLICHFYTLHQGQLSVIVKGARRSKSDLPAILQCGNLLDLVYYQKNSRDLQFFKEAELLNEFRSNGSTYAQLLARAGICEILERSQQGVQADVGLFETTVETLKHISQDCPYPLNHIYWFIIFSLARSGYYLDLARCGNCGADIRDFGPRSGSRLDRRAGVLHCPECAQSSSQVQGLNVSSRLCRVLYFLHRSEPQTVGQREITRDTRRELGEVLDGLMQAHMEHWRGLKCLEEAADN